MIAVVSSGTVYVQSGGNITDCIACLHPNDSLELYRECGGHKDLLLVFFCHSNTISNRNPRILLDTSSRCWTLPDARKNDSCMYKVHYLSAGIPDLTTDVRVLDRVLVFNITTNSSRLCLDMAMSVHYSAGAVTWEVGEEPLRLMDDHRTLIIPSVQREDAKRRFQVNITNPVSEQTWVCQLEIRGLFLISNITCNISRMGEDIFVSVHLSEEDNAVTWVKDGGLLPEEYRQIGDNRTLIIPSVQRDDAENSFWFGIKFMANETDNNVGLTVGIVVGGVIGFVILVIGWIIYVRWKRSRNRIPETGTQNDVQYRSVHAVAPRKYPMPRLHRLKILSRTGLCLLQTDL